METNKFFDFAKKYSLLFKEQKAMIDFGSFTGTWDEYAYSVGYSIPASCLFRTRCRELEKFGILTIVKDKENKKITWNVKSKGEIIDIICSMSESDFSFSINTTVNKHVDNRKYFSIKRHERYLKNKNSNE